MTSGVGAHFTKQTTVFSLAFTVSAVNACVLTWSAHDNNHSWRPLNNWVTIQHWRMGQKVCTLVLLWYYTWLYVHVWKRVQLHLCGYIAIWQVLCACSGSNVPVLVIAINWLVDWVISTHVNLKVGGQSTGDWSVQGVKHKIGDGRQNDKSQ